MESLRSFSWIAVSALILSLCALALAAEKKPWKDASVQVGDIKVHYIEAGTGSRHMVLIPGWTMIAEVWKEQVVYFAARGFHVVAIDPRSQGQTTKTEGGNSYHQQAADLHAFLKTVNIEHPVLVGWSAGVAVILDYISSPETLQPEKIVLVDGAPTLLRQPDFAFGMTAAVMREFVLGFQEDRAKNTEKFIRSMFKSKQPELLYKELIEGALKTPTGTAASLAFDLFLGDRRPALMRVPCPTLIVMSQDQRALGEYIQSKIGRSKLEVVPDAGHALFLEKPQTFNQLLEDFLGQQ